MIFQQEAITLIIQLISFAVLLQTIEVVMLKKYWTEDGVWNWQALREDHRKTPGPLLSALHFILKEKVFLAILILQIALCAANIIQPHYRMMLWMLLICIIQTLRWRGFFNGGSDSMTFVILASCVFLGLEFENEKIHLAFLWYIALQAALSYFIAGVTKAKSKDWWNGQELTKLMNSSSYAVPAFAKRITRRPGFSRIASIFVILFECTFPLAFLNKEFSLIYISGAVVFHLANFAVLGLNRFVFVWIAAYPAIYFLS